MLTGCRLGDMPGFRRPRYGLRGSDAQLFREELKNLEATCAPFLERAGLSDPITPSTRGRRSGGRGIGGENLGTLAIARSRLRACDTWSTWPSYLPLPRLVFSDIMVPHQGPAALAGEVALRMVETGVDAVGIHLQSDARRANPKLIEDDYLGDVARAVFERIGKAALVQVFGGLSIVGIGVSM